MKVMCASFDYGFNWKIKDATGNEVANFSTRIAEYVVKEVTGTTPFTVEVGLPDTKGTWIKSPIEDNCIVGVMGGEHSPVISTARVA